MCQGPCRQGNSEFDRELAVLATCPDCRGMATVHSTLVGDGTRNICVIVHHHLLCPGKWLHMAWTSEHAMDAQRLQPGILADWL